METLPDLASLSDADLKHLIDELVKEETQVSFERRVLQGRIDILRSGQASAANVDVASLTRALTGHTEPGADADLSPETLAEIEQLANEEREISARRRQLHGKIDMLKAELVARLQKSGGRSVIGDVDLGRLTDILSDRSAPPTGQGRT